MPKKSANLTNLKFGKLWVLEKSSIKTKNKIFKWLCKCECGKVVLIPRNNLTRTDRPTISCGCLKIEKTKTHGLNKTPKWKMFISAKYRAKKYNLPFNITLDDVNIPNTCPLLGIPLVVATKHHTGNSPSLDRIKPELGYVKGNVVVISSKANVIKNNATLKELKTLTSNLETILYRKERGIE